MTREEYCKLDEIMNADDSLFARMVEETKRINESGAASNHVPLDISHDEFMRRYHLISLDAAFKELDDIANGKV